MKGLSDLFLNVIDILFPVKCLGCREESELLCTNCLKKIKLLPNDFCPACKTFMLFGQVCATCGKLFSIDGGLIAANYYSGSLQPTIKAFKYRFAKDLGNVLSKLMITFLERELSSLQTLVDSPTVFKNFSDNILIPVPLHVKRLRWRGFNQAEVLADFIAKYFSLEINNIDLIRTRYTTAQADLNVVQRRNNLQKSFVWRGESLQNKNIILVDDVFTTGTTLDECARVLKQAGANQVWGLVIAKG